MYNLIGEIKMKLTLNELLKKKKEFIGKEIDIVRKGGFYLYDYQNKHKYRILTDVKKVKEQDTGTYFIMWYWQPQPSGLEFDCGMSGIANGKNNEWELSYLEI
jgi:hypothetical protein